MTRAKSSSRMPLGDLLPGAAVVRGLVEIGRPIAHLEAMAGDVRRATVVRRHIDAADRRPLGQVLRRHVLPGLALVARHLHRSCRRCRPRARLSAAATRSSVWMIDTQYSDDHIEVIGPPGIFCILSWRLRVRSALMASQELPFGRASIDALRRGVEHVRVVDREQDRQRVVEAVFHVLERRRELVLRPDADVHGLPGAAIDAVDPGAIGGVDHAAIRLHCRLAALTALQPIRCRPR